MIPNPLISICIPTRNNANYLKTCLNSLLPQVKPYNIPVYVSDNASTDNTIGFLSSFKNEHYQLLYFRSNDEDLGFDQNLINAVQMASSKYVWPIGDRRSLLPNSMRRVYNFLSKNDLNLLILSVAKYVKSVQNKRYTSARDVFLELWSNVGTLYSCISPTKAWRSEIPENYIGTGWIHLAVVFEFLARLKTVNVMFVGWPSIVSCGKSHWRLNFFQVWTNWKNVINALPDVYSNHDKESIIRAWSTHFSILGGEGLLYLRSKGVYNANVYNAYCKDFLKYTNISLVGAKVVSQLPVLFAKPYPILQHKLLKGLRFVRIRYRLNSFRARVLLRLVDDYYTEEKEVMKSFLIEVEHNTGLATYGEKEVRRALEEGAVGTLLLSEGLKSSRIFAKCNTCSYEEQQTLENQLSTRLEQNVVRKQCPKCGATYLGITEIQDLIENLAELAEQSSTKVEMVSVKTKEGQMLKNSFKGVAAILRSKSQERPKNMS